MRSLKALSLTSARQLAGVGIDGYFTNSGNNVLAIDETSAADALAGYLGVLKSWREGQA